jgi:hypothetical protein
VKISGKSFRIDSNATGNLWKAASVPTIFHEEGDMRFMLKAVMDTEKANSAAKSGTLGKTVQTIVTELKPEAAYFTDDHGKRTAYIFFDLRDASQIPAVAEPWFVAFNAHVEFHPVMNPDDLAKAGPSIDQAAKKYSPAA